MNIKITIEYDGTNFAGWQVQPDQRTVQGEIESGLRQLTGQNIRITGAGRTDAGVHAIGQVANFAYTGVLATHVFHRGLNAVLPRDIRIHQSEEMDAGFDARRRATRRTYRYVIAKTVRAVGRQYAWYPVFPFRLESMQTAAMHLIGSHSWESFARPDPNIDVMDSIVFDIRWLDRKDELVFEITAIRFFRNMVRLIMGTLMDVGRGKITPQEFQSILEARDLSLAGSKAPAHGLFLWCVKY